MRYPPVLYKDPLVGLYLLLILALAWNMTTSLTEQNPFFYDNEGMMVLIPLYITIVLSAAIMLGFYLSYKRYKKAQAIEERSLRKKIDPFLSLLICSSVATFLTIPVFTIISTFRPFIYAIPTYGNVISMSMLVYFLGFSLYALYLKFYKHSSQTY